MLVSTSRRGVPVVALLLLLAACSSSKGPAQPSDRPVPGGARPVSGAALRAQAGDTIYLIDHFVRAEQRQQFEDFVNTVLWPAFQRSGASNPALARVARQTRMLRPVAPNDDGTYTYTFVLDPVVPGQSYNVLDILRAALPEEEAKQEYGRFTEMWAREFLARPFVLTGAPSSD